MTEPVLPTGVVTYCLTDIVDSTAKWQASPSGMEVAVAQQQELIREVVTTHGGVFLPAQGEGDSTASAFARPGDAVRAAAAIHAALAAADWPAGAEIAIRAGIHTGEAQMRDGTYYGLAMNHTGRMRGLGNAGQTVVSAVTAELARLGGDDPAPGTELRDAGRYELKGLPAPERVYVLMPADDTTRPRLAMWPVAHSTGRIPSPPTTFIGRTQTVEDVVDALASRRLVTLVGPGGAGKTRLALEVARAVQAEGRGLVLVDLATTQTDAPIGPAIASATDLGSEDTEEVVAALAQRPTLVVLDNCEHVLLSAREFVNAVLADDGDTKVLATSQAALNVAGEYLYAVASLDEADAVALFNERARTVDPSWTDDAAPNVVAEICQRLDAMPLAIELAAAKARLLTPEQILNRIHDELLTLTSKEHGQPERHQTLRAAVDWSVHLLSDDERYLLTQLSVFRGGFSLAAVEAVCADERLSRNAIVDLLGALVDKSLVARRRLGAESQFWLLESVRAYAWDEVGNVATATSAPSFVLRREGDVWAVIADGQTTRLRHSKGLEYLAALIQSRGTERHTLDLAGRVAQQGTEQIDQRARAAYLERLRDLEDERDEAEAYHDVERHAKADAEIAELVAELTRAVGLSGRSRTMGDAAERARVSVTKAIRNAIDRLAAASAPLGDHLNAAIRTGTYCSYEPTDAPISLESGVVT